MKYFLLITLLTLGLNLVNAQKIINVEAKGNLESPNPCGCIELSEVTNENNPADILKGMEKCMQLKQYEKAARLFAIAGVFGTYDTYRVKDKSAHQALLVLQQNIFMNFEESIQNDLLNSLKKELKSGSKELSAICNAIQQVGTPKYYPKYMIQHGMQAFTDNPGDGLVKEFKSFESWNLSLKNYLHCGE
jgi:hypothetical protein